MHYFGKVILLICLCMSTGACALPTYSDPQLGTAADSEVAILRHRWGGVAVLLELRTRTGGIFLLRPRIPAMPILPELGNGSKSIDYRRANTKSHTMAETGGLSPMIKAV